jgi:predicted dehydrogenase
VGLPLRVGIVGVGKISAQYFTTIRDLPQLQILAVCDLDEQRALLVAAEEAVTALPVDQLIADPGIDAIINLTIPAAHAEVTRRALEAGKHVYTEKPLAVSPDEARPLLALAESTGLRLACAPDTVLGTGIQTARKVLDDGVVGRAVAASATWFSPGHERWHPAPQFYYDAGGGPLHDMGPYYLSALVTLLGPITDVVGASSRSDRERTIETGPSAGTSLKVAIDTHVSAVLHHRGGVRSTITVSFDVWASRAPRIELYGETGTIAVPDPNRFSDPVEVWRRDAPEWTAFEASAGYLGAGRGIGVSDLALAIEVDVAHRASAEMGFHVLEVMDAVLRSGSNGAWVHIESSVERPAFVPLSDLRTSA